MKEINSRVGAIKKADENEVHFYGYGIYEGDYVPESGWLSDAGIPNPRIKLDDGGYVYGYQCWWGEESKIMEMIGDRKVIKVNEKQRNQPPEDPPLNDKSD